MNEQDLRDCFAMFAMLGMISGRSIENMDEVAELSYIQADAMIKFRNQQGEDNEETNNGIAAVAPKRTRKR